jgi:hypothetical protein
MTPMKEHETINPPAGSTVAYHYTKVFNLCGIFRAGALLPSPPLAHYGLCREAVEANPARHGFREGRAHGRRCFLNNDIPDQDSPQDVNLG